MRSSKNRSRNKQNRPRSLGNIINRVFDSSGPESKVRGTPQQIIEKYQTLARDAQLSNDRVAAENFLQHAEHYTRLLAEAQREMNAEQEARQQFQQQNGSRERGEWRGDREFRNDTEEEGAFPAVPDGFAVMDGDEQPNVDFAEPVRRDYRPREDRARDDRPREDRPREDRPREDRRPRDDRRDNRPREERPREERPREERSREERPREDRPREDRPREDRRDNRPREDRREPRVSVAVETIVTPQQAPVSELPAFITGAPVEATAPDQAPVLADVSAAKPRKAPVRKPKPAVEPEPSAE